MGNSCKAIGESVGTIVGHAIDKTTGGTGGDKIGAAVGGTAGQLAGEATKILWNRFKEQPTNPAGENLKKEPPLVAKAKAAKKKEAWAELRDKALQEHELDSITKVNICVVGIAGSGKSSFINAIRGVHANEPTAAKVGITETTEGLHKFQFPPNSICPFANIWDLAGYGTLKVPVNTYFDEYFLFFFDHIVLLVGDRLGENDVALALRAQEYGIPVSIVKSKADILVANFVRDNGKQLDDLTSEEVKAELVKIKVQINDSYVKQLGSEGMKYTKVYLVCTSGFREDTEEHKKMDETTLLNDIFVGIQLSRYRKDKKVDNDGSK